MPRKEEYDLGQSKKRSTRGTPGVTYLSEKVPSLKFSERHLLTFLKLHVDFSEEEDYPELSLLMGSGGKKRSRSKKKSSRRKGSLSSSRNRRIDASSSRGDKYTHLPVVVLNALPEEKEEKKVEYIVEEHQPYYPYHMPGERETYLEYQTPHYSRQYSPPRYSSARVYSPARRVYRNDYQDRYEPATSYRQSHNSPYIERHSSPYRSSSSSYQSESPYSNEYGGTYYGGGGSNSYRDRLGYPVAYRHEKADEGKQHEYELPEVTSGSQDDYYSSYPDGYSSRYPSAYTYALPPRTPRIPTRRNRRPIPPPVVLAQRQAMLRRAAQLARYRGVPLSRRAMDLQGSFAGRARSAGGPFGSFGGHHGHGDHHEGGDDHELIFIVAAIGAAAFFLNNVIANNLGGARAFGDSDSANVFRGLLNGVGSRAEAKELLEDVSGRWNSTGLVSFGARFENATQSIIKGSLV